MSQRIGLIGCGLWGRNILRDLQRLGCDVFVVEPDAGNARLARSDGATQVHESLSELGSVDGIVVATPATTHRHIIESCARFDVPIFSEKPFTTTIADAQALASRFPDRVFVMHVWRYHPGIEHLAHIAREKLLGDVVGLRTTRTNWTSPRTDVDGIWTLIPHDVSIALEIFNVVPEPEAALAEIHNGSPVGLVGLLRVRQESGTSTDRPATQGPWLAVDVSTRYRDKRREVRLHCTDGVAVLSGAAPDHIEITRGNAESTPDDMVTENITISEESALIRELQSFLDYLDGGPAPRTSAIEAVDVVRSVVRLREMAGLGEK